MTARRAARQPNTAAQQPISVASAAKTGDTLAALVALRDRLAQQLDETHSGRDTAALSRQLSAVLAQIEATPRRGPSKRHEIAAKRARRQAEAARRAPWWRAQMAGDIQYGDGITVSVRVAVVVVDLLKLRAVAAS